MQCPYSRVEEHVDDEQKEPIDLPEIPVAFPAKRRKGRPYNVVREAAEVVRQAQLGTLYNPQIPALPRREPAGVPPVVREIPNEAFPIIPVPPERRTPAQEVGAGLGLARQQVQIRVPRFADVPQSVLASLRVGSAVEIPAFAHPFPSPQAVGARPRQEIPQQLAAAIAEEAVTQEVSRRLDLGARLVPAAIGGAGAIGGGLIFNAARRMQQLIGRQPAQDVRPAEAPFDESQEL